MKSPHKGWIIVPATDAVRFVGDETGLGGLLKRSLSHIEGSQSLYKNVIFLLKRFRVPVDALKAAQRIYAESPFNEQWAKELRESDYALLNKHSLIGVWGALETSVEDTIVSILHNWDDVATILQKPPLQISAVALESDEAARKLYAKIESKFRVSGDVVATYEAVLNHFDLTAAVKPETALVLREANALRNCLLHRSGRIDQRALREAPALAYRDGDQIRISSEQYLRYHDAVAEWLDAHLRSVVHSIYFPK